MSDLIDRQALENWLRTECYGTDTYDDKEYVIGRLREELPTVAASPWHRVEDELPKEKQNKNYKDFEYVLCATTFGDVRPFKFGTPIGWDEPHFWYGADGIMDKYVTHWMPLPEPPKEDA